MLLVIAHELAHIALGHTGVVRGFIAKFYKKLSRLNEHSADRVAFALVQKQEIVLAGLLMLTAGHQLMKYVNFDAVRIQAKEVAANPYSLKAERSLSHPLQMNRIARYS